jgi:hypothetical protein
LLTPWTPLSILQILEKLINKKGHNKMSREATSKVDKLLNALGKGKKVTYKQAQTQFGFTSRGAFTSAIAKLRGRGVQIETTDKSSRTGLVSYYLV